MHGRLKVKTSEQQERERNKEKEVKQKKYISGFEHVVSKRKENSCDEEVLLVCAQLLMANPDALSLWNYRREVIKSLRKIKESDYIDKLEESELGVTESCLLKNHKSYGAWHHRQWILGTSINKYWDKEMDVCDQYLSKDERNFHCWDHRRVVAVNSTRSTEEELKYSQKLIEENLSNYSAWHYRSKLLPIVHPPENNSPHPIKDQSFLEELNRVISAIFTDPNDQSPWFFLRWLLTRDCNEKKIVRIGIISGEETNLVIVFNSAMNSIEEYKIDVSNLEKSSLKWIPDSSRCIWSCPITMSEALSGIDVTPGEGSDPIHLEFESSEDKCAVSQWLIQDLGTTSKLSDDTRKSLNELYENCLLLDSVDAGNKWVLLTLVNVMWSLDSSKFLSKILGTLDSLREIDRLRDNYYRDIGSKLQMEVNLATLLKSEENSFSLSNCQLSRVVMAHYLCYAERVDLSRNNIRCLEPLSLLLNCRELILDENLIEDLEPLRGVCNLEVVSIQNCGISTIDQLKCLNFKKLKKVYFKNNLISDVELNKFLTGIPCSVLFVL